VLWETVTPALVDVRHKKNLSHAMAQAKVNEDEDDAPADGTAAPAVKK
jgi:hypothetical protein